MTDDNNNGSDIPVISNYGEVILNDSIKKVYYDYINNHRDVKTSDKWIYKFTIMSQLSFYLIPLYGLYIIYSIFNHYTKDEDNLSLKSFVIFNTIIIVSLHVYGNYLSPPELQFNYI